MKVHLTISESYSEFKKQISHRSWSMTNCQDAVKKDAKIVLYFKTYKVKLKNNLVLKLT